MNPDQHMNKRKERVRDKRRNKVFRDMRNDRRFTQKTFKQLKRKYELEDDTWKKEIDDDGD